MIAACKDNSEVTSCGFSNYMRTVCKKVTETDRHADKNTLTHPHSKYTQVQRTMKTTMITTTYRKLCSGSLRHMRYIGQLSRLGRSQRQRHCIRLWSNSVFRLLVEDSQHKKLCQSVVVGPSHSSQKVKTFIYETVVVIICVKMGGGGEDRGWTPLSTCPQRYCEPALLVKHSK